MTPKFWDMLNPQKRTKLNRLKTTMLEGSPKYHYNVPALAAGVFVDFDIQTQFPQARKYEPLDNCVIINNDAVDITVQFNGAGGFDAVIPAGVIRTLSHEELGGIWYVRITNNDAVAATIVNMIDLEFYKQPEDADSVARRSI